MSPLETLARDIAGEIKVTVWEGGGESPRAVVHGVGNAAKAGLQSLIRMAEGNQPVALWLEAMLTADE